MPKRKRPHLPCMRCERIVENSAIDFCNACYIIVLPEIKALEEAKTGFEECLKKELAYVTGSDGVEYSAHTRCEDAPCCGCC